MRQLIESKKNSINIDGADSDDRIDIHLIVSSYAAKELIPLLETLQSMGSMGSSRTIKIEDWDKNNNTFGFDGDGSAKIDRIAASVQGKE